MFPHTHFLFGVIAALIGVKLGIIGNYLAVTIALLSLLMDLDHFLLYYWKTEDKSLVRCWNWLIANSGNTTREDLPFHTLFAFIAILVVGVAVAFFSTSWSYVILATYFVHRFLDMFADNLLMHREMIKTHFFGLSVPITSYELIIDVLALVVIIVLL